MKSKMLIALMLFFVTEFAVAEDKVWYCSDLLVIGAEFNKSQWQISEWARGRHVIKQTADNQLEFWRFLTGEKGHVYCHSFSSPKNLLKLSVVRMGEQVFPSIQSQGAQFFLLTVIGLLCPVKQQTIRLSELARYNVKPSNREGFKYGHSSL